MTQLKNGDIVRLKSGGPNMTVNRTDVLGMCGNIECQWFDKTKMVKNYFSDDALILVPHEKEES